MPLGNVNQAVVRRQQCDASHPFWITSRQVGRHPCAQRFAHQVHGAVRIQQLQRHAGGFIERPLTRRSRAVRVAGIFDHEHVERGGLLQHVRVMAALAGAIGVTMHNEHLALDGPGRREPLPSDRVTRRPLPAFEPVSRGLFLRLRRGEPWGEVDKPSLETGTAQARQQVKRRAKRQGSQAAGPKRRFGAPRCSLHTL